MKNYFKDGIKGFRHFVEDGETEEVTRRLMDKIKENRFNAYITVCEDAIERAREIDKNEGDGRLLGMPIAVKDNLSTRGVETTCASKILRGYVPPYDAAVVERLKEEGAIIVGKTNMDEFAMGTTTETSFFGPTRNPWDEDRVPGGSSGGSAAAVASGECIASLGTDTGGSVRCPASFCGISGIKPTYGLVSRYGLIAYSNSLECVGTMGSSIEDASLLLDVISGKDSRDSTSIDPALYRLPSEKFGKIGVLTQFFDGVEEDVLKHVWNAIHKLEDLGIEYEEIDLPNLRYALSSYYIIAMSEASSNLARYDGVRYGLRGKDLDWDTTFSRIRAEGFGKEVKRRILMGTFSLSAGYYGKYYLKALKVRNLIIKDFERAFRKRKLDAIVSPTMPYKPFKLGEKIEDPISMYLSDIYTVPVNLTGLPSVSIPCGFSEGLPIGIQLIGRAFDEETIINIAKIYEENTDHQKKVSGLL
ncbi:MAG: Asp-tRNA(Asn)/Glu-tRNA(Gln) amidotransferase subunit GatA [Candidatus Methanolliviera hydrocarbonicum]|uniref:Glutamyl-tRNA(Gln) amidotransferase subunit A n=1 Tax=Candidatus Methanolliviera hydrocarbonicum TaxID=2491085 RepID=A0A520KY56_9EURY|nr:MAG: Asp-tRNA(Asn)/Glu-tRNA(Gln) amidotransferase subunit GatA [Candidatus Methanolliviera hydrocarbonicum]